MRNITIAMLIGVSVAHAVIMDRIAVTAGKQVILESEITRALRVAAFLDQEAVDAGSEAKRRAAERLVDQFLMLREAAENRVILPGEEEAAALLNSARMQFGSEADYRAALARYNVTETEVRDHLLAGYRMLKFTDLRFRPEVQIADSELREFYQFISAGWRRDQNGQLPTFEESEEQVKKLLLDQKAIQALDRWLSSTRTQLVVSYREKVFE